MKKQTLNEQVSRIKGMMKKMVNESYDYDKEEESYITQKEDLINRYKNGEIDKETYENADTYLEDNHYDFWMDGLGIDYVLQQIKNQEPSDDDLMNGPGREGGVSYGSGDSWQGR